MLYKTSTLLALLLDLKWECLGWKRLQQRKQLPSYSSVALRVLSLSEYGFTYHFSCLLNVNINCFCKCVLNENLNFISDLFISFYLKGQYEYITIIFKKKKDLFVMCVTEIVLPSGSYALSMMLLHTMYM